MYKDYNSNKECPYLISEEDHWCTTSYPRCTCNMKHCKDYPKCYCPVRDD